MPEEFGESGAKHKPQEFLEPGVLRIKPTSRFKTLIAILIRITLASIFLAAGVGAVVYSVIHSAELLAAEDRDEAHHTHKDYFKFYHDQSCTSGILTIEFQSREEFGNKRNVSKIGTSWIQARSQTQKVYDRYTVLATKEPIELCIRQNQTYYSFLRGFGLFALPKVRKERILLGSKVNEKPVSVELYQGEPKYEFNSTRNAYQWVNGSTVHIPPLPYLATSFTQLEQGLVYGWQAYFQTSKESSIHWMEFWFPNMTSTIPDASVFFDYPAHCLPS